MNAVNSSPLVSVSMITYNQEIYIRQTIEGILAQKTNFDFEFIIANDCSPDDSDIIIQEIINTHPRGFIIKYFRHANNIGMQPNSAFAISQCKAPYIAFCEGDDFWTDPFKLQKQTDFMVSNKNLSFTFHGAKALLPSGELKNYFKHYSFQDKRVVDIKYFLKYGSASFCSASLMLRRDVIENLPKCFEEAKIGDYLLIFMALRVGDIGYLADQMCVYRINAMNSWSLQNRKIKSRLRAHYNMIILNREINKMTNGKYRSFLPLNIFEYGLNKLKLMLNI